MTYFSVILPIYNVEKYLEDCIDSILSQDFSDYELILVDDGSKDNSGEICNNYRINSKVKVIHKENGGLASARNTGIVNAEGKWCIFIDSDDYIGDKSFLKEIYNITENSDVVIYGCSQFVDGTDKIIRHKFNNLENINNLKDTAKKMLYLNKTNNVSISAWTHSMRRDLILKNNLFFDETIKVGEDIDWFFRVMLCNPTVLAIGGYPYYYRIRNNSLSSTRKEGFWRYRYKAIELSEQYLENSNCEDELKYELLCYLSYQYYILLKEIGEEKNLIERNEAYIKIKKLNRLSKYGRGKKSQLCRIVIKIFGTKNCSKVLALLKK